MSFLSSSCVYSISDFLVKVKFLGEEMRPKICEETKSGKWKFLGNGVKTAARLVHPKIVVICRLATLSYTPSCEVLK